MKCSGSCSAKAAAHVACTCRCAPLALVGVGLFAVVTAAWSWWRWSTFRYGTFRPRTFATALACDGRGDSGGFPALSCRVVSRHHVRGDTRRLRSAARAARRARKREEPPVAAPGKPARQLRCGRLELISNGVSAVYLGHLACRRELHSLHHILKGLKTLSRDRDMLRDDRRSGDRL